MIAEHRKLGSVELLMWGLQLKLDRWSAGQDLGPPHLKVPPFGRTDVGWPILRAEVEASRVVAADPSRSGITGWLRRVARGVLFGRGSAVPHERISAFHSRVLGALDHFFARLQAAEGEAEQASRQLLELRQSLGSLKHRIDRLEEKLGEERAKPPTLRKRQ